MKLGLRNTVTVFLAGSALIGLASACGTDQARAGAVPAPAEAASTTAPPAEVRVSSIDNSFRPETVEVPVGTTVTWTNDGRNDHNVLPDAGDAWGVEAAGFKPGDVYSHTFTEPGTYGYYCSLHGVPGKAMYGVVTVTA